MSSSPSESTSEPVKKAALTVGAVISSVLSLVGAAVTLGVVSSDQAQAITNTGNYIVSSLPALATAVTLVVGILSGVGASLATAWHARTKVVPADSDVFTIVPTAPLGTTRPE